MLVGKKNKHRKTKKCLKSKLIIILMNLAEIVIQVYFTNLLQLTYQMFF